MIFRLLLILPIIPSTFLLNLKMIYRGVLWSRWKYRFSILEYFLFLPSFGDINLGGTVLKDSEFLFAFEKKMQLGQELKTIIMITGYIKV
ncbi:MAG: hypothetical protein CM1200mP13_16110 [Candidatus Pelagibacterales bacterium]|nr:MAG: hypothetical protein CM1200mP13_16110 [Pelagibacterales bacterium]